MSIQYVVQVAIVVLSFAALSLCWEAVATGGPADKERDGGLPKPIQDEDQRDVRLLAYSPKHKLIASVPGLYNFGQFGKPALPVYVWDLPSGKRLQVLIGHGQQIDYVAFTPDGDQLLSGASDGVVLWDPLKGTKDSARFKALSESPAFDAEDSNVPGFKSITPVVLTPSGKELFNWNKQAGLIIWDVKSGKEKRVLKATDETRKGIKVVNALSSAISADEHYIALGAGLMNRRIIVWDYKKAKVAVTLDHDTELSFLRFSQSSRYLFAGGNEVRKVQLGRGVLDIWDTESWKLIREIEVDEFEIRPILYLEKEDMVLTVDLLRPPEVGRRTLFKTLINGYSIKTGKRLISCDTQLATNDYCTAAIYLEDLKAICIGDRHGKISFFSVAEVLKHKKQP